MPSILAFYCEVRFVGVIGTDLGRGDLLVEFVAIFHMDSIVRGELRGGLRVAGTGTRGGLAAWQTAVVR